MACAGFYRVGIHLHAELGHVPPSLLRTLAVPNRVPTGLQRNCRAYSRFIHPTGVFRFLLPLMGHVGVHRRYFAAVHRLHLCRHVPGVRNTEMAAISSSHILYDWLLWCSADHASHLDVPQHSRGTQSALCMSSRLTCPPARPGDAIGSVCRHHGRHVSDRRCALCG